MFTVVVVFHVIVSLALILVVLMQSSKGEGLAGSAFGGGLSGAVFGGRGAASFLSKATAVLAVLFMLNSGALALMSSGNRGILPGGGSTGQVESVVTQEAQKERERAIQEQQQQQGQTPAESLQVPPLDVSVPKSGDTSGQ
ncbi:MAG: preprotein translocase subunit SecG [Candidatus Zixiibacteriota bacterium]